jgi:branched-chain amino acid transport system substrate-binding protein
MLSSNGARAFLALGILVLGLGAAAPAVAGEVFEIPVVLSLTGSGAFLGQQQRQTLTLAEQVINKTGGIHGRPVHFAERDDQSNPQVAVQIMGDIVARHPPAIVGSSLVAACKAMAPLVKNGPVMYCLSPAVQPPPGGYMFASSASTRFQAEALLRFFRAKGWRKIALVNSSDATGQEGDREFGGLLSQPDYHEIKLVAHEHFNITDVSISAQLERVRAGAPQAVIFWASGTPAATVLRGLVQAGFDVPVGSIGSNMTYAQMTQYAAFLPKQFYLPNPEWPAAGDTRVGIDPRVAARQKELYAAYAAAGIKVDAASVGAWDPAMITVGALRRLPADGTAAQLRSHIAALHDEPGVQGLYDFVSQPQRGLGLRDILVTRWNSATNRWDVVSKGGGIPLE